MMFIVIIPPCGQKKTLLTLLVQFNLVLKEAIFQLNGYYRWTTCLQHVAALKGNWKWDLETGVYVRFP